jgi:hypothetical protein
MTQCYLIKPDGKRCKKHSMKDSNKCFTHDEKRRDEFLAAAAKGGRPKRFEKVVNLPRVRNAKDVLKLMNKAVIEIERLESTETRAILLLRAVNMADKALR